LRTPGLRTTERALTVDDRSVTPETKAGDPFAHAGARLINLLVATVADDVCEECAFCGRRLARRDLITVHEGHHDNLTFFNGELVCRKCARANGVEF
jgi:hypothetical protein